MKPNKFRTEIRGCGKGRVRAQIYQRCGDLTFLVWTGMYRSDRYHGFPMTRVERGSDGRYHRRTGYYLAKKAAQQTLQALGGAS